MASLTSAHHKASNPGTTVLDTPRTNPLSHTSTQCEEEEVREVGAWVPTRPRYVQGTGSLRYANTIEFPENQNLPPSRASYVQSPSRHSSRNQSTAGAYNGRPINSVAESNECKRGHVGLFALKNPGLSGYDLSFRRRLRPDSRSTSAKVTSLISIKSSDLETPNHHDGLDDSSICRRCGLLFRFGDDLKRHECTHASHGKYKCLDKSCQYATLGFQTYFSFKQHWKSQHRSSQDTPIQVLCTTQHQHGTHDESQHTAHTSDRRVTDVAPVPHRSFERASKSDTNLAHDLDKHLSKIASVRDELNAIKLDEHSEDSSKDKSRGEGTEGVLDIQHSHQHALTSTNITNKASTPATDGDSGRAASGSSAGFSGIGSSSGVQGSSQGSDKHRERAGQSKDRDDGSPAKRVREGKPKDTGLLDPHLRCLDPACHGTEKSVSCLIRFAETKHRDYFCKVCMLGRHIPAEDDTTPSPTDWHNCAGDHCITFGCGEHLGTSIQDARDRRHLAGPGCRQWDATSRAQQLEFLHATFNNGALPINYWTSGKRPHTGQVPRPLRQTQQQRQIAELQRQISDLDREGGDLKTRVHQLERDLVDARRDLAERDNELRICRLACAGKDRHINDLNQVNQLLIQASSYHVTVDPRNMDLRWFGNGS